MTIVSKTIFPIMTTAFLFFLFWQRGAFMWDGFVLSMAGASEAEMPASLTAQTEWGRCRVAHLHGRRLLLQGHYEAALPQLQAGTACDAPRWAWLDRGRAEIALGQPDAAVQSWQQADAYEYVARLARHAQQADALESSFAYWKLAAQVAPDNPQPYVQMSSLTLSVDIVQAEAFLQRAITLDGTYAPAYYALGSLYLRQNQDMTGAQPYFEKAHQLAPQQAEYLIALAQNTARFDTAEAIVYWERVADMFERHRATAYHQIGQLWLQQDEPETAVIYYLQAVADKPENAAFLQALAQTYGGLGCIAEAEAVYNKIIALQPGTKAAEAAQANLADLPSLPPSDCPTTISR